MAKKEEIKINNLKELYASLKQNLQDTSEQLSGFYDKIEGAKNELKTIKEFVLEETKKLEALRISSNEEIQRVHNIENSLNRKEESFIEKVEKHENDVKDFKKYKEEENRKVERVKIEGNKLFDRNKEMESNIKELEKMEKAKRGVLSGLTILHNLATETLEKVEKERGVKIEEFETKKIKLKKEIENLNKQIDQKQKSVLAFKKNVKEIEERLRIKANDLSTLEARLKKAFAELGRKFIVEDIKIPTFKQK